MSMNKYIHSRNKYKNPPDFTQLAVDYPDFRNIGTLDITGRFKIDFKNSDTLPILTKCLLDKDFGLKVDFPPNKLVPTLALRLNYIHWLEDIFQKVVKRGKRIIGIDIGCGASCIYPLLASKLNQWQFFALETNLESCNYAKTNILNNKLESLITVIPQSNINTIFHDLIMKDSTFKEADFCMCNPPFFNSSMNESSLTDQEIPIVHSKKDKRNRTGKRALPKNAKFGCDAELYVEGGECNFVEKIILESCQLKSKIQVYTTMLGHKTSVKIVLNSLHTKGITNICQTQFCQGHTTRWGIAWSFNTNIPLELVPSFGPSSIPNNNNDQCRKKSFTFDVPLDEGCDNDIISLITIYDKLKRIFNEINLKLEKFIQIDDTVVKCELLAAENTWSNQRRKRREMKQKICLDEINVHNTSTDDIESFYDSTHEKKKIKLDNQLLIYLRIGINILKHPAGGIVIRLEYLDGTANNDGVYQILQFLRNHWK